MKRTISALMIIALLLMGSWSAPTGAANDEIKSFHTFVHGKAGFVQDEIIVKYRNDAKPFRIVKVPPGKVKESLVEYAAQSDVAYVEPNFYAHAMTNDPYYVYQWNFGPTVNGGIDIEQAWNTSTGTGVTVAIIDTGIAYENYGTYVKAPDLAATTFVQGYDFINNDSHPNDDNSHGTHVAGTIAQSTNNGVGVAGIAYNAKLMPIKVLDKSGSGSYAAIANGIYFAADNGAKVINMSLGGSSPSTTLENALSYAYSKGVTIIAAAGNDGANVISYPAAYDRYVIAVGATRYDGNLAPYSNYGSSLDLVAPGGDTSVDQNGDGYGDGILQNTFNPTTKNPSAFGYYFFQGTSMATPHVSGIAALLISNGNATSPDDVRSALQQTSVDLGSTGWDSTYGWGIVNASAALGWSAVPTPNTAPIVYDQSIITDEDTAKAIQLTATDAEGDALTYTFTTAPAHGTLSGTAPSLTYTPSKDYNGSDTFSFKANDGKLDSNVATVNITINPVNDAPVADSQSVTTRKNTPINIILTASDVEGDAMTFIIVKGPSRGVLTGNPPNLTYTPNARFTGSDSFTFKVNDGKVDSNIATVKISVKK